MTVTGEENNNNNNNNPSRRAAFQGSGGELTVTNAALALKRLLLSLLLFLRRQRRCCSEDHRRCSSRLKLINSVVGETNMTVRHPPEPRPPCLRTDLTVGVSAHRYEPPQSPSDSAPLPRLEKTCRRPLFNAPPPPRRRRGAERVRITTQESPLPSWRSLTGLNTKGGGANRGSRTRATVRRLPAESPGVCVIVM